MNFTNIIKVENLETQRCALIEMAQDCYENNNYKDSIVLREISHSIDEYIKLLKPNDSVTIEIDCSNAINCNNLVTAIKEQLSRKGVTYA